MHFIITWEIYTDDEEWEEINDEYKACLDGLDIVQVLKTTYVVKVQEQQQFAELHEQWAKIAESNPGKVEFIMSPLMKAGQYAGYFRQEKYEELTSTLPDDSSQ